MRPRRFHGANKVFRLSGGNEDQDLWTRVDVVEDATLGQCPSVISVYELTDEERERIAAGGNIEVNILGTAQPPIFLQVTHVPLGKGKTYYWKFRKDGWPLCPLCGEDGLWSSAGNHPEEVRELEAMTSEARRLYYVERMIACDRCNWKPDA